MSARTFGVCISGFYPSFEVSSVLNVCILLQTLKLPLPCFVTLVRMLFTRVTDN